MNTLRRLQPFFAISVICVSVPLAALETVTLGSKGPLVDVKVMIKAGSRHDPAGKEGTAALAGELLVEGGFGDPKAPVTKDALTELTRPWGTLARPRAHTSKETTVISATVPQEKLAEFARKVLVPMLTKPLFDSKELERVRGEALQGLRSGLRFEQIEMLGLVALDNVVESGTRYAHPAMGTEKGLQAVTREDLVAFHAQQVHADNVVIGVSGDAAPVAKALEGALADDVLKKSGLLERGETKGRRLTVVTLPNAISSGLHLGFPIEVTRAHADFWPLYVANVWFGTHRDSFAHLYNMIREERGYNYGDYSYIEHFEGRPYNLFPPFNTPRLAQYFSIWVRPVAHQYVPHLLKAITFELDRFVRAGLTEEQCASAKNKAKVLYLSLAETKERLLAAKLDDAFYGMKPGYLDSYVKGVEGATCAAMNAAVKKHLQTANLHYLVVTHEAEAPKIVEAALADRPVWGKEPAEYQIDVKDEGGKKLYVVPEAKLDVLRRDAAWAHTPLELAMDAVTVAPAAKMFETAELPR